MPNTSSLIATKNTAKLSSENSVKRSHDYEAIKNENLHLKAQVVDLKKLIEARDKLFRNNCLELDKIKLELSEAKTKLSETNDYLGLGF